MKAPTGRSDESPVLLLERTLPVDSTAPGLARKAVESLTGWLSPEEVDNLQLLVSEITTNAVRYGGPRGPIRLVVSRLRGSVRAAVTDQGDGFKSAPIAPSLYQESGWGLYLVQQLAGDWGVTREHGTTVWFDLDVGPDGALGLESGETG